MTEKRFRYEGTKIFDDEEFLCCTLSIWVEQLVDLLNSLNDENEQLQHDATILIQSNQDYRKENEQLKERNNRQAKQLDNLYTLIEKQDWKTLKGIIQEFQECEEQLQREWKCYE